MQADGQLQRILGHGLFRSYESRWGALLLSPWIVGFVLLMVFPLGMTFYYSLLDFSGVASNEQVFIGFGNYARFFKDPIVLQSLTVTLSFAAIAVPIRLLVPVALAALLNSRHLIGKPALQALFFFPSIIPDIAMMFIWAAFLTDSGWLNRYLVVPLGLPALAWPPETPLGRYLSLSIMSLWGIGPSVLILSAAMRNVPGDLYEAAMVDGAEGFQRFFRITLPIISPALFFILLLTIVNAFHSVTSGLLGGMSRGRTGQIGGYDSYLNLVFMHGRDVGYAATLSWMLLLGMLVLTAALFYTTRYWVHYEESER